MSKISVFVGLLVALLAFNQAEVTAGVAIYLPMDENSGSTANDASGYGNNGTISGAAWTTGIVGSALQFDGVNDKVNCGNDVSLQITGPITIEHWTYLTPPAPASYPAIMGRTKGWFNQMSYYTMWLSNGKLNWLRGFVDPIGGYPPASPPYASYHDLMATTTITTPGWYHSAYVWDGLTMYIYVDGVLENSRASTLPTLAGTADLLLGFTPAEAPNYFGGKLDEVAIFDEALSADKILAHYNKGLNGTPILVNPVASITANPTSAELPLVLSAMKVTPQTLNVDSQGDGMTAVDLAVDEAATNAQTVNVTLNISVSDSDGTVETLNVDYGDGNTEQITNPASPLTLTHAYGIGNFTLEVLATDNDGLPSLDTASVSITRELTEDLGNGTYYLEGVPNIDGGSVTIIRITFPRQDVIDALAAQGITAPAADVEMLLTGDAIATDYIDIISKDSRGKSTLE